MINKSFPQMQLSDKVSSIPEALSVYINNIAYEMKRRGERVFQLSLGEAYFDIPMFSFDEIDFNKGYHYTESRGLFELRERIAEYYGTQYDAPVNPDNEIILSAGSKPLIFMAIRSILNEGDEVLIHEPAWLSYPEEIKLAGGTPRYIPYDTTVEHFSDFFSEKTKMVIICNPNNPTGRVYSKDELLFLYHLCRSKGIYVFVDEAYSDFVLDDQFHSMISLVPSKDGVIVVNSLSKNMGVSGYRVGYAISNQKVVYNILKINQHMITCPASLILLYLSKYFDKIISITLPQAKKVVEKRRIIDLYCRDIGLVPLEGSATFYLFIHVGDYNRTTIELALYLLFMYNICVVPGSAYGNSTERFVRISVGAETISDIMDSLQIMKRVIDNNEYDEEIINEKLRDLGFNKFIDRIE